MANIVIYQSLLALLVVIPPDLGFAIFSRDVHPSTEQQCYILYDTRESQL
jgi:hypothetical protein